MKVFIIKVEKIKHTWPSVKNFFTPLYVSCYQYTRTYLHGHMSPTVYGVGYWYILSFLFIQ